MPTLAEIKRQIAANPHNYIFWTQKEIRALPDILDHDEAVKAVTSGIMDNATWLAVCTNRRVIFLNRGMFFGTRQLQVPLERIQMIDHEFAVFFGSIRVWDGASYFTIGTVLKSSILPFVKATEEAMHEAKKQQKSTPQPHTDIASQLEKLVQLKEKGYLTEEEFQAQKKKLLA